MHSWTPSGPAGPGRDSVTSFPAAPHTTENMAQPGETVPARSVAGRGARAQPVAEPGPMMLTITAEASTAAPPARPQTRTLAMARGAAAGKLMRRVLDEPQSARVQHNSAGGGGQLSFPPPPGAGVTVGTGVRVGTGMGLGAGVDASGRAEVVPTSTPLVTWRRKEERGGEAGQHAQPPARLAMRPHVGLL